MKKIIFTFVIISYCSCLVASKISLEYAIHKAIQTNPEIGAFEAKADSENANINPQYFLDNPRLSLMRENKMYTPMSMNTWGITQDIKFPIKYYLMGSAQSSRAESAVHLLAAKKLEIRRKVINAYYVLYAAHKTLALLEAQKKTLIEVARSAERRYSTGLASQQDEMKAHVEQTKLEVDILTLKEENDAAQASLNALLNQDTTQKIDFDANELIIPKLTVDKDRISALAKDQSKQLKSTLALYEEATKRKQLAGWNFVPDFAISYKKAWTGASSDNYVVGVDVSIPIWFFIKQTGEYKSAKSQEREAQMNVEKYSLELNSQIRSLLTKVRSHEKILQIYNTSLIPQATGTLNSSRSAYQAGKVNFLELLDTERSLYGVQIAYYQALIQYIDFLTQIEEVSGVSLSTLPFRDIL